MQVTNLTLCSKMCNILTFHVVPCIMLEIRYIFNLLFCPFGRSVFKNVNDGNCDQFFFKNYTES